MSVLGDAILAACSPLRVNYDILGNTDQFLHAHVFHDILGRPKSVVQNLFGYIQQHIGHVRRIPMMKRNITSYVSESRLL